MFVSKCFINLLVCICILIEIECHVLKNSEHSSKSVETTSDHGNNEATTNLLKKCDPCPKSIQCVPQIQCPAHVRMKDHEKPQICDLPGEKFGYCCETGQNHTATPRTHPRIHFPSILTPNILEESRQRFELLMRQIAGLLPVQRGQPEFMHGMMFHSSPQEDLHNFQVTNSAMEQIITNQVFAQKEHIAVDDIITDNLQVELNETPLAEHCAPAHVCRDSRALYRAFDGSCNNNLPHRSHWGAAGQPMERMLPPAYDDGIWKPRSKSVDGTPLKSAREISRTLMTDVNRPHARNNLLMMQFGQFLAHDVSQTSTVRLENGDFIQCCKPDGSDVLPPEKLHFACLPILVGPDDDFYAEYNVRCMNFVRLSLSPNLDCKLSYGKQRSKVTHFLDASPVYGSSAATARDLRTFRGGKLRMLDDFGRDLLPLTTEKNACETNDIGKACFKSGDGRTNQMISLIVLHLLFAREHNRIAKKLAAINPSFTDEQLFQEARKIVIAQVQHITYNEYLPALVGHIQVQRFGLIPQHHGYSEAYRNDVNPAVTNEFTGAAFRMGHSTVDGKFHLHQGGVNKIDEIINIPDVMFNPSRMRKRDFYDEMLRTLVMQPMQKVDTSITQGLSRYLFRGHHPFGLDLAAFNIQRGRDQGLRPYNDYLELIGQRRLKSFKQLPTGIAEKLSTVYNSPEDIDLWVGGLLERSIEDGIVGTTFAEIIADQFSRLKVGDRYFYEYNANVNPGAFTIDQLQEIRKVTMARLICNNADHLTFTEVPPSAFVRGDIQSNLPLRCDDPRIPFVNLEAWRV